MTTGMDRITCSPCKEWYIDIKELLSVWASVTQIRGKEGVSNSNACWDLGFYEMGK